MFGSCTETIPVDGSEDIQIVTEQTGEYDDNGVFYVSETVKADDSVLTRRKCDSKGQINEFINSGTGTTKYTYDSYDRVQQIKTCQLGTTRYCETYSYNEYGELTEKAYTGEVTQTYSYAYKDNAARDLDHISFSNYKFKPLTDVNGRNTGREIYNGENKLAAEYITYRKVGDHATNMPATVWFGGGNAIKDSIKYKYDSCGNICQITENGHLTAKYAYDSLNRLIREDNKALDRTVLYTYDNNGNIVERCEYDYTSKTGEELSELNCTHYSYDYDGDKLISYNGEICEYESNGRITKYRGKALQWQYGKRLIGYDNLTFSYDGAGRRIQKKYTTTPWTNQGIRKKLSILRLN